MVYKTSYYVANLCYKAITLNKCNWLSGHVCFSHMPLGPIHKNAHHCLGYTLSLLEQYNASKKSCARLSLSDVVKRCDTLSFTSSLYLLDDGRDIKPINTWSLSYHNLVHVQLTANIAIQTSYHKQRNEKLLKC